jgi:hypothetical protein
MIFQETYKLVLSRVKIQTTRLAHVGDTLCVYDWRINDNGTVVYPAVLEAPMEFGGKTRRRPRWIVGHEYAVQPERCHKAVCRIRVTSLAECLDPTVVDEEFARREGMDSVAQYLEVWHKLHPKNPVQRAWVIGFERVKQ